LHSSIHFPPRENGDQGDRQIKIFGVFLLLTSTLILIVWFFTDFLLHVPVERGAERVFEMSEEERGVVVWNEQGGMRREKVFHSLSAHRRLFNRTSDVMMSKRGTGCCLTFWHKPSCFSAPSPKNAGWCHYSFSAVLFWPFAVYSSAPMAVVHPLLIDLSQRDTDCKLSKHTVWHLAVFALWRPNPWSECAICSKLHNTSPGYLVLTEPSGHSFISFLFRWLLSGFLERIPVGLLWSHVTLWPGLWSKPESALCGLDKASIIYLSRPETVGPRHCITASPASQSEWRR
jgi:hypothetical protein